MPDTKMDECTAQLNETLGSELHGDMELSAQAARLRYVQDDKPGFGRKRTAKGFRYVDTQGRPLRDEKQLARIRSLAIPPAWEKIWICPYANGHLQATGYDARQRKQYRYHKEWRAIRDEAKFEHIIDFALHLPLIRERIDAELTQPGLSRDKVLALVVALLETTMIRIGNDEYARNNGSFGLTTLRNRHVEVSGGRIAFHFKGKSRVEHAIEIQNARLARLVRKMKELPGQELFQYLDDDGKRHAIDSSDVNDYLKRITGRDYTAKDFRTWSGTVQTFHTLSAAEPFENQSQAKKNVLAAITEAARKLGNTPSICRKCYVHPLIIDIYMTGKLFAALRKHSQPQQLDAWQAAEQDVLALLQRHAGVKQPA